MRCRFKLDTESAHLLCFEKVAETPADDARLRHESLMLGLAAHPGVVTLRENPMPSGGPTVLRTRAVRGRPLALMDELTPAEVAGLGGAVATIVADLHDVGITHRALRAEHIVIDRRGRPVLCGFSEATATTGAMAAGAAKDVMAIGQIFAALVPVEPEAGRPHLIDTDPAPSALARLLHRARTGGRATSARRLAELLNDRRFAPRLPARDVGGTGAAREASPPSIRSGIGQPASYARRR